MAENWPDYEVTCTRFKNLLALLEYGSWKQRTIKYASREIEFPARFEFGVLIHFPQNYEELTPETTAS